jgi:hypothetical protein
LCHRLLRGAIHLTRLACLAINFSATFSMPRFRL